MHFSVSKLQKGITLMELLIVIGIIGMVALGTVQAFSAYYAQESLDKTTEVVQAILEEARWKTIASYQNTQYGVHVEQNRIVLFQGDTFVDGAGSNQETIIQSPTVITSIVIAGGSDIIFNRITGATDNTGTITLSSVKNNVEEKTIFIALSGLIEISS